MEKWGGGNDGGFVRKGDGDLGCREVVAMVKLTFFSLLITFWYYCWRGYCLLMHKVWISVCGWRLDKWVMNLADFFFLDRLFVNIFFIFYFLSRGFEMI